MKTFSDFCDKPGMKVNLGSCVFVLTLLHVARAYFHVSLSPGWNFNSGSDPEHIVGVETLFYSYEPIFTSNPILGGLSETPILGGSANLHYPHISGRKNALFIIFGKNVHFHKYFEKTWRKFKKSDDISRFWAKICKIQSKSGKFRSKKQNPITSSNIVQFWCFTHKMKAKTLNFLQIMKKSRKYRNADLWSSGFDRW